MLNNSKLDFDSYFCSVSTPFSSNFTMSNALPASTILFARGVIARLSIWSTLQVAIQEGWGGPGGIAKRTWLASEVVDAFEESPLPDDQYIEELLLQVMADEFEAVLEDGSAESVAKDIITMWNQTKEGNADMVDKFEKMSEKVRGKNVAIQIESDDNEWESEEDGDSDDVEEDAPQLMEPQEAKPKSEPVVDEDGFTLVQGKGKGRR
ncbi:Pre-rRNA-processing protein TSR2-domain-containing protein [Cyathus striatus]|nr:Pre-rRNA-processing protein TSR2-domain-containing protein [Cyathus striatus]